MKRKKMGSRVYELCWNYLKESKKYFLIVVCLLLFSGLIGFLFPIFLLEFIRKFIEDILAKTQGMNFFQLFLFILKNNVMTAFFGFASGIFLGLVPLLLTFLNGYVLGFVMRLSVSAVGLGSLWRLFPHGIFEMPALIISLGLGLKLGMFVFSKKPIMQVKYDLENSLRVFIFVVVPLLLIAGVVEAGLIFLLG